MFYSCVLILHRTDDNPEERSRTVVLFSERLTTCFSVLESSKFINLSVLIAVGLVTGAPLQWPTDDPKVCK